MNTATVIRHPVPAVRDLHLIEDRFVTHDVAELRLPHASAVVRRHVDCEGSCGFSGHITAAAELSWIDDTLEAAQLAEAATWLATELDAARAAYQRGIFAAMNHHPVGGTL